MLSGGAALFFVISFADGYGLTARSQPKPFVCSIKPRDAQHAEIIRREWKEYVDQGLAEA